MCWVLSIISINQKVYNSTVEIATLTRENGQTKMTILGNPVVEEIIKKHEEIEAKAEAEKKKEKS